MSATALIEVVAAGQAGRRIFVLARSGRQFDYFQSLIFKYAARVPVTNFADCLMVDKF